MKTYNHLLEKSLKPWTVAKCALDAAKGKTRRKEVQEAFISFDKTYETIKFDAANPRYFPREDNRHVINDGTSQKKRIIEKPMFCPEQIFHHILIEPFQRILLDGLYEQVYGCIPEMIIRSPNGNPYVRKFGPHAAAARLAKWTQGKGKIYCAELDVHHAYQSVDLDILMDKLRKTIKDRAWLGIVEKFLRGRNAKTKGLVLGHFTSPWFFNFYLKDFDHFAAALDGVHYLRYADNLFLVGHNKRKMHRAVAAIQLYLQANLEMELNRSAQVYRFEWKDKNGKIRGRPVNALGVVIHYNRITLRKSILRNMRRKAARIARKERVTWYDAASMLARLSYIRHTATHGYYEKYIRPNINTGLLKRKVRNHSREMQPVYAERRKAINDGLEKSDWLAGRKTAGI